MSHALLSASGAHKWLNCTPSPRLEETIPEQKSEYADEGNLAHDIGKLKLKKAFTEPMGPRTFNSRLKKFQEDPLYQKEMLDHTDTYLDYISKIVHSFKQPPYIAIEKQVDYSAYVPEGFGTSDCIIIGGNILHVIDLKYGKGVPVSAKENDQMRLYALGAWLAYSFLYPIELVSMSIVQPRLDDISEYTIPVQVLLDWAESIKPKAQMAYEGKGEFVPGEHCRFCRARSLCRARSDFNLGLEEYKQLKPPIISNAEVGAILLRAQQLAKWVADLESYALTECLAGNEIPGWKAVEGRSVRQFTSQDQAFEVLKSNGVEDAMLYERKPITLASIEKLLGKSKFTGLLSALVTTPPGKPALVVESDKREAIKRQSAADDFQNNEGRNDNE